jgi:hypothetical protein
MTINTFETDLSSVIMTPSMSVNMMKLCLSTKRQIKGHLVDKTLFLRRGTLNTLDNFMVFIERETKSVIKFNPNDETFFNGVEHVDIKEPFAIEYLKNLNGYIISDDNKGLDGKTKINIVDDKFSVLQSFICDELVWPHDVAVSEDERFMYISDFGANFVFKFGFEKGKELEKVAKFAQDKPIDIKISSNKLFVVSSCDYVIEAMKLIYINGSGNSISVYDLDSCKELYKISHVNLLEPQGLYIDEKNGLCYVAGLFVDEETRLVHLDLHLFCFDSLTFEFLGSQTLGLSFEVTICDMFLWNDKLFLSAFKDGIYAIDIE